MFSTEEKEYFMREALKEAKKASVIDEVPIGAVIVKNNQIIGRGYNQRETSKQATSHAEIFAIQEANDFLDNWRLEDCAIFISLEPCPMCAGAIMMSRIPYVYYAASDKKGGTAGSLMNLLEDERFNHQSHVEANLLQEEASKMLKDFFKELRMKKKERKSKID